MAEGDIAAVAEIPDNDQSWGDAMRGAFDTLSIADGPTSTACRRTLGTGASQAAAGNDSRITGSVQATLFDANTILAANTDNTPAALTVAASTILGRKATGNISAMTAAEAIAVLGIADATATPWIFASFGSATIGATGSYRASAAMTLTQGRMRVIGAPVGSALTVQLQRAASGTPTTWASVGSALTIAAGSTTEVTVTLSQAMAVGDLLRANVTSVGSTTAATGAVVEVIRTFP